METYWDKNTQEIINYWDEEHKESTLERFAILSSFLLPEPYESLLDVGCGHGNLVKYCDISEQKYIGVDYSVEMIKRARERYPGYTFLHSDIMDYDKRVDALVAHGFLYHQYNLFEVLSKLSGLTRRLLIFNVNVRSKGRSYLHPEGYWSRDLAKEEYGYLKRKLERTGFVIREVLYKSWSEGPKEYYLKCER